jgi:hypothetical protein
MWFQRVLECGETKHWYYLFYEYNESDCGDKSSKESARQDNIDEAKSEEAQGEGNESDLHSNCSGHCQPDCFRIGWRSMWIGS